jgi:hypothetical protein
MAERLTRDVRVRRSENVKIRLAVSLGVVGDLLADAGLTIMLRTVIFQTAPLDAARVSEAPVLRRGHDKIQVQGPIAGFPGASC